MKNKNVVVIGGGVAGMSAASSLKEVGANVYLLEKENELGGNVKNWFKVFPDFTEATQIISELKDKLKGVEVLCNTTVNKLEGKGGSFKLTTTKGEIIEAAAIVVATGFTPFDATLKEEYGYGVYENCITSVQLDKMLKENKVRTASLKIPASVAMVHCVGSRDEKVNNYYCSRVCCTNGIKKAIELRQLYPNIKVFCLYMDIRTYGRRYEEFYRMSQEEMGVNFIRGRLSEADENPDGSLSLRIEDTLSGLPLKMTVELLVLLVGMKPAEGGLSKIMGLKTGDDGFFETYNMHTLSNHSNVEGIFLAGTASGPKTIVDSITDGRSAAMSVLSYLNKI